MYNIMLIRNKKTLFALVFMTIKRSISQLWIYHCVFVGPVIYAEEIYYVNVL